MFLIHAWNRDLRNFCHDSRVAVHKTKLIAPKRPREAGSNKCNANKSSSQFSIFYLHHIYAVLFLSRLFSPLLFSEAYETNNSFARYLRGRKHALHTLPGILSFSFFFCKVEGKVRPSFVDEREKKPNRSHGEILRCGRHADRWNFKRLFASRRGYVRISHGSGKRRKGLRFAASHLPQTRWPLTDLTRQRGFERDQETISIYWGWRANPFPFLGKIYYPCWGTIGTTGSSRFLPRKHEAEKCFLVRLTI